MRRTGGPWLSREMLQLGSSLPRSVRSTGSGSLRQKHQTRHVAVLLAIESPHQVIPGVQSMAAPKDGHPMCQATLCPVPSGPLAVSCTGHHAEATYCITAQNALNKGGKMHGCGQRKSPEAPTTEHRQTTLGRYCLRRVVVGTSWARNPKPQEVASLE